MKKLFLIPLMACFTCMAFAYPADEKFHLGVTDGSTPAKTVAFCVHEGLNLHFMVPTDATVDKSAMTLNFFMQNVPALGVTDARAKSVEMGLNLQGTADLSEKLSNVYGFNAEKQLVVSVKANGATQSFLYTIAPYDNGEITAAPSPATEAMAAWNLFAAQFKAQHPVAEANAILVKAGSYIQFGGKELAFKKDYTIDANFWTSANLAQFADDAKTYTEVNPADAANVMYLAKGSTMFLGHSSAELLENVTITLEGATVTSNCLSQIRSKDAATSLKGFVALCNDLAGCIKGASTSYLTINFGIEDGDLDPGQAEKPIIGERELIRAGVTPGYYYTVCLPYEVASYDGAVFYVINKKIDNGAYGALELVSVDKLEAGYPYVFIPTAEEVYGYFTENYEGTAQSYRGMIGTYEIIKIDHTQNYYVFGNTTIRPCGNPCFLAANRAYIDMTYVESELQPLSNLAGRVRKVVAMQEVATGLGEMPVEFEGTKKMVVNGQLIILRDGVKYNAQGAVIE